MTLEQQLSNAGADKVDFRKDGTIEVRRFFARRDDKVNEAFCQRVLAVMDGKADFIRTYTAEYVRRRSYFVVILQGK